MLHCGDLGYDLDDSNGRNGDAFLRDIEPIAAYVPYMVSAGNHERAYNFSHYKARFRMPSSGDGREDAQRFSDNHYYSFDLGPVHVVAWNSEAFFYPQYFDAAYVDKMYDWLASDLRSTRRSKTPWIVAHAHRPMYCAESIGDGRGALSSLQGPLRQMRRGERSRQARDHERVRRGVRGEFVCARRRRPSPVARRAGANGPRKRLAETRNGNGRSWNVERLLYDHGVDLAFFGHVHDYERYLPVFDESVETAGVTTAANEDGVPADVYFRPRATVHVTTGSGGNKEMLDARRVAKQADNNTVSQPLRGRCADVVARHRAAPWCAFASGFAPKASLGETSDFTFSRVVVRSVLTWEQVSAGDPSDAHVFVTEGHRRVHDRRADARCVPMPRSANGRRRGGGAVKLRSFTSTTF